MTHYWFEIGTFGGLGDYECHGFSGTKGAKDGCGYIMTPTHGGTPRWVNADMVSDSLAGAKKSAYARLKSMKEQFFRCINGLMARMMN